MAATMNTILLFSCFSAALSCGMAAGKLAIPNWNAIYSSAIISEQNSNPASRATCNIPAFKTCILKFFSSFGLSQTTLPAGYDFTIKFGMKLDENPPQGFKDICGYFSTFASCAVPADCWTVNTLMQLGFPNAILDVPFVIATLWPFQYICTTGYKTALDNFDCAFSSTTNDQVDAAKCNSDASSCAEMVTQLNCYANVYSRVCNNDVGKMFCGAYGALSKALLPNCNAADFDNACNLPAQTTIITTTALPPVTGTTSQMVATTTRTLPPCDSQTFKGCASVFFLAVSFSSTTPNVAAFKQAWSRLIQLPGGVEATCLLLATFKSCVVLSNQLLGCWSVNGFGSLGYSAADATLLGTTLFEYDYLCTSGNNILTANAGCVYSDATNDKISQARCNINMNNVNEACSGVASDLTCIRTAYSNACNSGVGQSMCEAYLAAGNQFFPQCSAQITDACKDQSGSGPIDRVPSVVLIFFTALLFVLLV